MKFNRNKSSYHQGFSLIEVLITSLLLTIGALGMIGMQLTTINNAKSAQNRAQALFVMSDIANRMRHNKTAATEGHYVSENGSGGSPKQQCETNGCSSKALAEHDLWQWHSIITGADMGSGARLPALPDGNGSISKNNDGSYTITVSWRESLSGNTQANYELHEVSQRLYL